MDPVAPAPKTSFTEKLFTSGVTDLISVIPPAVSLSSHSKIPKSLLGKIPGRRGSDGLWAGFNWRRHTTTIDDVRRWHDDGANIGLRADRFPGVDIDCLDPQLAEMIENFAIATLGPAPIRIGKPPKRLLMYRTAEPFGRLRLFFKQPGTNADHLVEILGRGQQYLVYGTHPTRRLYEWLQDPTEQPLTEITGTRAAEFLDRLESQLREQGFETRREGDGRGGDAAVRAASVDQAGLRAPSLEALRDVVAAIPNDESFPSRTDYIRMGYAIKAAAGPEQQEDGFEIFAEWAARWDGGFNDPEIVRADWRRMNGAKTVGWSFLCDLAKKHGFDTAQYEFAVTEPPPSADESVEPTEYSDQWLAKYVVAAHPDSIRFVPQRDQFLVWDGVRWKPDDDLLVEDTIKRELAIVAERVAQRPADPKERKKNERFARSLCSATRAAAVRTVMTSERSVEVNANLLDADPWIINTPGGTIDLVTGILRPSDPSDLCTRVTAVAPDFGVPCPVWQQFLDETTGGDVELQQYLQRLAGYCLTGSTREQQLTFVWGPGGNGKSVFLNALVGILGDYARVAPMDTFTASASERHPTEMAMLAGARLVAANETANGKAWDDARLKSLTGGDAITARFMRQDFFTYLPAFKLVLVGNHKPALRTVEDAIKRRLHIVPFTNKPKQVDPDLASKLKAEWPAILAWMIQGCLAWQQHGLKPPTAVVAATTEYIADQDVLGHWIDEKCERAEDTATELQELFNSYRNWVGGSGESAGTIRTFGQLLVNSGFKRRQHARSRRVEYLGIRLRSDSTNEPFPLTDAGALVGV